MNGITNLNFELSPHEPTDAILAKALDGSVAIDLNIEDSSVFSSHMAEYKSNHELQSFFVNSHAESFIFDRYKWNETRNILTSFSHTTYDAVMAMGIAACEVERYLFTGQEHFDQIKKTSFDGLSGTIEFDQSDGTRTYDSVQFKFINIVIDKERSDNTTIRLQSRTSMLLNPKNATNANDRISVQVPYIFRGGSMELPLSLPPLNQNRQHIPLGVKYACWTLAVMTMGAVLGLIAWTWLQRNQDLIRVSQPLFLTMMLVGVLMMASSVLFLGWEEPCNSLGFICTLVPWLLILGFSTAFSALFAKTWRMNRILKSSLEMKRASVRAKDVLWPFLAMTLINVGLLTFQTIFSPVKWVRVESTKSVDMYGRATESYGHCTATNNSFMVVVWFNFLVVAFATYQSYLSRNYPYGFNESLYVAISMASLLECFLIGGPILRLVEGQPTSDFVLKSVLILFVCGSIIIPIYIHKFVVLQLSQRKDWTLNGSWLAYVKDHQSGAQPASSQDSGEAMRVNLDEERKLWKLRMTNSNTAPMYALPESPLDDHKVSA